ncbi:cyclic nucleotide-binding domain protein [Hallella bergensis DSM 17361]|uniref:Cyclic nucleotide-binding domain protein n=2 Tax=Hallella bergensis TaxID=242750 RepID=D1PY45_9BACT|nr:cyclic nucleotide-binding domain protein [Hallella bergensis DSM 17361]
MEDFGLYRKLITLPLFVGMGKDELERIIARIKFDFLKVMSGENIVSEGEKSGQLMLLVDGEVEVQTYAHDNGYVVCEYLNAPYTLQPERTFGLTQRYSSTIKALTTCSLVCINKNEILRLTSDSLIFRLNLLNTISTALQKRLRQDWKGFPQNLNQRIVRFFISHCTYPAGRKVFKIKMARLARELNDSRLHVSQVLNAMADDGLVILSRGKIEIPSVEQLLEA